MIHLDLQRCGVFTASFGEGRETARFRRQAPKRCACPGEEGETPGAKRAGGRNPTLKGGNSIFQRSEEGAQQGIKHFSKHKPVRLRGRCATASGQRRREPGQGDTGQVPKESTKQRKCPDAVGGDSGSSAGIRVRAWRGQGGQAPTSAFKNKGRSAIAVGTGGLLRPKPGGTMQRVGSKSRDQ